MADLLAALGQRSSPYSGGGSLRMEDMKEPGMLTPSQGQGAWERNPHVHSADGTSTMSSQDHDYDWLVIVSGFGGSVSALRLAQKGYSVGLLECGRRFADTDFARSAWDVRRFYWL